MFVVGEWLLAQLVLGKLVSLGTGSQTMLPAICKQHTTDERVIITNSERERAATEKSFPAKLNIQFPNLNCTGTVIQLVGWLGIISQRYPRGM